jgi:hypothetical protein
MTMYDVSTFQLDDVYNQCIHYQLLTNRIELATSLHYLQLMYNPFTIHHLATQDIFLQFCFINTTCTLISLEHLFHAANRQTPYPPAQSSKEGEWGKWMTSFMVQTWIG